jgi:preprotein translocase subunit SecG
MLTVVIVIHLMLVLALIGVVLLQKSEGGGLVSSTSGFLSSRGTANVLTRATALLAAGFFATSLALSWLASFERKPVSIINTGGPVQEAPGGTPFAPLSQSGSQGVLNQLQHNGPAGALPGSPGAPVGPAAIAPAAPVAPAPSPSAPQVPESR